AGLVMLARYRIEMGGFEAFADAVETMLALSETLGHPRHRWRPLLLASMRAVALGHFAESDRYVTEVTDLAAIIDPPALPTPPSPRRSRSTPSCGRASSATTMTCARGSWRSRTRSAA